MASRGREGRRSNVRRTNVTACMRCRARKQRCDQNIPACSNCERAGVECVSLDIDGRATPRSYIKSLEDRVAYLESQLANRETPNPQSSFTALASSGDNSLSSRDPVDQVAFQSLETDAFYNNMATPVGQSLLRSLLAEPIRSVSQTPRHSDHRSLLGVLPNAPEVALPTRDAAVRLVDAYFEHCEFFSPILPSKEDFVASSVALLYKDSPSGQGPKDPAVILAGFRAYTVFATVALLLNRTDPAFHASTADGYFATASRLLAQNPAVICTGDLQHVYNLLLVGQYTCFVSNLSGAWHFIGLASRLVVELSLHDERAVAAKLDRRQLNQRRWLFWAFYTLERNLCVIIGRPFSIPDEAIHTPLPELSEDGGGGGSRALALHLIKHRRLESEIHATLNQKPPQNGASLDVVAWRDGMRRRVTEWLECAPAPTVPPTQLAPAGIFEPIMHNHLVALYYPSRSSPDPPPEKDVLVLARSAAASIGGYRLAFRDGQLRFFWRTTHNLFRSGVAVCYCLRLRAGNGYRGLGRAEDLVASVNTCASLLWAMVERYPLGAVYRDAFEALADSVLNRPAADGAAGCSPGRDGPQEAPILAYDTSVLAGMALQQTTLHDPYWGFGNVE
ncbi:hypothetical protein LX36DRAFT_258148 [Colletotrichum falcatum]|nr:hypothetical protein LX36DRAFT_258148 [Colletotrichum falcatum]